MPVLSRLFVSMLLLAALGLGGCNLVMSEKPMFSLNDTAGAPGLRPGVWAAPDADCKFDPTKPADEWPKCASGSVLGATTTRPISRKADAEENNTNLNPEPTPYLLVAGEPRILQVAVTFPNDKGKKATFYLYMGINPLARDSEGRIIKAEGWFVQCGPPPPKDAKPHADAAVGDAFVTRKPLPGMKVSKGGCEPRDAAAVRGAVIPSRAWADTINPTYWVRDGEN